MSENQTPPDLDVSGLDPSVATYIETLRRERDNALGRCKNYQIQANTMQSIVRELQSQAETQNKAQPDLGKAASRTASHAIASLKSVGKNLFKKRPGGGRRNSTDGVESTNKGTPSDVGGAAADASDSGLALAVASTDDQTETLGYAETLERDVRKRDTKIHLLMVEVAKLRELHESVSAELVTSREALTTHTELYNQLKASYDLEAKMRHALEKENATLEKKLLAEIETRKVQIDALDENASRIRDMEQHCTVQREFLQQAKTAFSWMCKMNQLSETQLMEIEDQRTQAVELCTLQRQYMLFCDIKSTVQETQHHHGNPSLKAGAATKVDGTTDGRLLPDTDSVSKRGSTDETLASPVALTQDDPVRRLCQSSNNDECPNVAMEGWLTKKATKKGVDSWKERYVRLRCLSSSRIVISYFSAQESMDHMKRRLVLLSNCRLTESPAADPLIFSLTGVDAHDNNHAEMELILRAPEAHTKQVWFTKLQDCVDYLKQVHRAGVEEPDAKEPVDDVKTMFCTACHTTFNSFKWRYHCYFCGHAYCFNCLEEVPMVAGGGDKRRRCDSCLPQASDLRQRLSVMDIGQHASASSASIATGYSRSRTNHRTPTASVERGGPNVEMSSVTRGISGSVVANCLPCGPIQVSSRRPRPAASSFNTFSGDDDL